MSENKVLVNGEIIDAEEATTTILNRGYQMGDGVSELVPVYNGRCFAVLPHMESFFTSVMAMKLPGIYTVEELVEFHEELIKANNVTNGEVYTQITRGSAPYNLEFPEAMVPELTMQVLPTDRTLLPAKQEQGVNLITEVDNRWLRCDINILNKLPEVLAKQKAKVARAFDTLFIREDGTITETTESNFYVVKDELLWTHPTNNLIRHSVAGRLIKERLAVDLSLPLVEKAFNMDFVQKADEVFIAGTRVEIMPVTKIDRHVVGNGEVGPITRKLLAAYQGFIAKECRRD